jgi:flavodoxin
MKVLVAYQSETGNTKVLAQAIFEGVEQEDKKILPIEEAKGIENYDLVFCGFPVKSHSVPKAAASFLKDIPKGKKIVLFATHGSLRGGPLAITAFHHALGLVPGQRVLGTFGCRGKVKSSVIEGLMGDPEGRAWASEAQSADNHPDMADLEDGREFARRMISRARFIENP